jgi:DNA polymerase I-like protein with 3'-5' exonuclease and polymerase domains
MWWQMNLRWEIVTDERQFKAHTADWIGPLACDTETYTTNEREGKLLGVSLSPYNYGSAVTQAIYIPFNHYENGVFTSRISPELIRSLKETFQSKDLIGHNFTYDKRWLDHQGFNTHWVADTRIAWHLSAAPSGPRPYDLKSLQTELLGWANRGDTELADHVLGRGGSLSKGDHYLADLEILAKYACLDTIATIAGWCALKPFFDRHEYHWMMSKMMQYNLLLDQNTQQGILVDVPGLEKAHKRLTNAKEAAKKRLDKALGPVIRELETDWLEMRLTAYKRTSARELFLAQDHKWKKFNWNSDSDKRELFYDKLQNEVIYTTESGKPSCNADSVKQMSIIFDENGNEVNWVESYLKYEKNNTLVTNFTGPYLDSVRAGRIHPGFNICGTVSYRLSGFKPYLLNAPYDEKIMMKNFVCDPGWVGVHADLAAIEPTIIAHYSQDPNLLKVFRDGLGDIYLDLALGMFPNDVELRMGYNPREPVTELIKKTFSRQRKIAKVIHLAVSYTGTKNTVHRNLMKEGINITLWEADALVKAYWRTFKKVEQCASRLRELNRKQGHLRNAIGRIIRVPDPDYKDLFNRFVQSSGHDILVMWVMEIDRLAKEWGIEMRPVVIDIHDSTSWQVEEPNKAAGAEIFATALKNVEKEVGLDVPLRMEFKTFKTLAGLKGED